MPIFILINLWLLACVVLFVFWNQKQHLPRSMPPPIPPLVPDAHDFHAMRVVGDEAYCETEEEEGQDEFPEDELEDGQSNLFFAGRHMHFDPTDSEDDDHHILESADAGEFGRDFLDDGYGFCSHSSGFSDSDPAIFPNYPAPDDDSCGSDCPLFNPASGLFMANGLCSFDTAGNSFGFDSSSHV